MRKIQQFYIYSLNSFRLKKNNYKLRLDLHTARKNNEVITLAESQLIRTLLSLKNSPFSQDKITFLLDKRKRLVRSKKAKESREEILALSKEIDSLLYIPELVSITFDHVAHYKKVCKDGFIINGIKYVRLMAGAGHLRRSTVLFVEERLRDSIVEIFENGINKSIPLNYGKYGAYFGLYSSSSLKVSTPNFVVVPDLEFTRKRKVDFVNDTNDGVEEKEIDVTHNAFDGQGLISKRMARQWSQELGLDYEAIQFIVRAPFIKGLLVSFPFHNFSEVFKKEYITDIYGQEHIIKDVDVILTESQFKMGKHYKSLEEFKGNCERNNLLWGVTRVNPKKEKDFFYSSYQYLQVLNNNVNVEELCQPTLDFFRDVSNLDYRKTLVYLLGEQTKKKELLLSSVPDFTTKVLMMEPRAINDPHIRKNIIRSLNKRIKESYTGKLLIEGNYQFVVFDPYALAQHAILRDVPVADLGILKEGETYSDYWRVRSTTKVASGRSPLTWRSELNVLNLIDTFDTKKWFEELYSGIVFSIHGADMMLYGDGDGDGDSLFTTNNQQMIENALKNGKPVTYTKQTAPKNLLDYGKFVDSDSKSFASKIGLITNYSTTYYSMQSMFPEGSPEYEKINQRLIICRRGQGNEIDKTKGIETAKFPDWGKKIPGDDLHNSILVKKRPLWMIYLYSQKKQEWDKHVENYNFYSYGVFGIGILELLNTEKEKLTKAQSALVERFIKYSPVLINANGVVDRVSTHMRKEISEFKELVAEKKFDPGIYKDDTPVSKTTKDKMIELIKRFRRMKKDAHLQNSAYGSHTTSMESIYDFVKTELFMISTDLSELTNCALELSYGSSELNDFVWQVLPEGIFHNLRKKKRKFQYPKEEETSGDFVFMNKNFRMVALEINE